MFKHIIIKIIVLVSVCFCTACMSRPTITQYQDSQLIVDGMTFQLHQSYQIDFDDRTILRGERLADCLVTTKQKLQRHEISQELSQLIHSAVSYMGAKLDRRYDQKLSVYIMSGVHSAVAGFRRKTNALYINCSAITDEHKLWKALLHESYHMLVNVPHFKEKTVNWYKNEFMAELVAYVIADETLKNTSQEVTVQVSSGDIVILKAKCKSHESKVDKSIKQGPDNIYQDFDVHDPYNHATYVFFLLTHYQQAYGNNYEQNIQIISNLSS